ncbi:unnamed protein product [Oikopleura dioica]|uniref:GTP-binding protein 1 n=1 Tax=Oikopleura dioica TaxID=34765 RepID=E4YWH8_OIKDI|nr:unnamed protein product [Oikopleura dioica]
MFVRFIKNELSDLVQRICTVGNVDAGKSTLLGVLTHNILDDGRGLARNKLLRHRHEKETGRTSSIGQQILGFDDFGNVVNPTVHGKLDWGQLCQKSSKIVNFYDLAGHEKYFKTTVSGIMGSASDYCMLVVGSNHGLTGMAREHLGVAVALGLPTFAVVTKIDFTPANIIKQTISGMGKAFKSSGIRRIPILVQNVNHVIVAAENFNSSKVVPIFKVSSVNGEGMDNLKLFLNLVRPSRKKSTSQNSTFAVDEIFYKVGIGTVVAGALTGKPIKAGSTMSLGPDENGKFSPVGVRSIERKYLSVSVCNRHFSHIFILIFKSLNDGESAALALRKIKRNEIRKGMFLVQNIANPMAYRHFRGTVTILHHATTIKKNYQAVVHIGSIHQSAKIMSMDKQILRSGDVSTVHFYFLKRPEYIQIGQLFLFREGKTKAIGRITELVE